MDVFIGDTVVISLDTKMVISGYSKYYIKFKRPDGQQGIWTAALDPSNNKCMTYTTLQSDLNIPGTWALQAHVEVGTTALHGAWVNFQVLSPGNDPHNYLLSPKTSKFLVKYISAELV